MDCDSPSTTTDSTIHTPLSHELCRLCANADNQLMHIFQGEGLEHDIHKKIEKHIPIIKITEADHLPQQVCYQCASTLNAWHILYEGCAAADKRLREILQIDEKHISDFDEDDRITCDDTSAENTLDEKFASKTNDGEIKSIASCNRFDRSSSNQDHNLTAAVDADCSNDSYSSKLDEIPSTSTARSSSSWQNCFPKVTIKNNALKINPKTLNGSVNRSIEKSDQKKSNLLYNFRCTICLKSYSTKGSLKRHLDAKHNPGDPSLQNVEPVDTKQTLSNECRTDSNILRATENSANTNSKNETKNDDNAALDGGNGESDSFTCGTCNRSLASLASLRRHVKNGHRRQEKRDNHPLNKWLLEVDGEKHLKCDKCPYNTPFHQKLRFSEHYRIHTGEKPFMCGECGKMFRTKPLMRKHILHVHQGVKEHPCDICGRKFSDRRFVAEHRRLHTGERPYVCDLCGKTYAQSASLFIHMELHKGVRKHSCSLCGKGFKTRSCLSMHVKRHRNERNFVCAECGKAFVDRKHLKDHMTVHSDERPFICEICSRGFKLIKHLKQHKRTHQRVSYI